MPDFVERRVAAREVAAVGGRLRDEELGLNADPAQGNAARRGEGEGFEPFSALDEAVNC